MRATRQMPHSTTPIVVSAAPRPSRVRRIGASRGGRLASEQEGRVRAPARASTTGAGARALR
eukprot:4240172-Pyramimonas_sp.AAC.1